MLGYGIDKQEQLPSGKVQVTFSTVETSSDDEDDDDANGYRSVCVVAFDDARGQWIIEAHEDPVHQ